MEVAPISAARDAPGDESSLVEPFKSDGTTPSLPDANYFEVAIVDKAGANGFSATSDSLYVSLVSQTEAYTFTQYQNATGQTVYVAEVDHPSGSSVASIKLSELTNTIDNTVGFYVKVFDGSPVGFKGGRIYFADKAGSVPYSSNGPGGIDPDADFDFDFVEFTVDPASNQLNLDTTQVDQFGMPIYLQVDPVVPDFANGTGIRQSLTRVTVIQEFKNYTADGSNYTAYQGVYTVPENSGIDRLLAPQHVIDLLRPFVIIIDGKPQLVRPAQELSERFDEALYRLFNHYYGGVGGGGHTFYLVGNGSHGPEIFSGQVVDDFQVLDNEKPPKEGTYTVFEFTGSGYHYDGTDATLTPVGDWGGATYQIFYPYFGQNDPNAFNTGLSSSSNAPQWFGGLGDQADNVLLSSAGRMVFGASGVFADDTAQKAYYSQPGQSLPTNFDHTMLGNLENQLVTMLNRGVVPVTGNTKLANNMQLRTGSNSANDLIYVDLTQTKSGTTDQLAPDSHSGATTSWTPERLITEAGGAASDGIVPSSLTGTIYYQSEKIQTFSVKYDTATTTFDIQVTAPSSSPANQATGGHLTQDGKGHLQDITIEWDNANGIPDDVTTGFSFEYGLATSEAHYATLHLFSPYDQASFPFSSGDLGPSSDFSQGLVGASSPSKPTSGMTMTGVSLTNPTYVYRVTSGQDSIIIHSPQALKGLNTNILTFSDFYPVDSQSDPVGQWNAYAAFFHIGDPANKVAAPTVDGKGYAFAFDDNGGYSSDITVDLPDSNSGMVDVVSTVNLTLLPWEKAEERPPEVKGIVLSGDGRDNVLTGGAGNDSLFGGLGNDVITGGEGDDFLRGNKGDDIVDGGAGNDDIRGDRGNDRIFGGAGNDFLRGNRGNDFVAGGDGDDSVFGDIGNDTVDGGDGNDLIDGGVGHDVMSGRSGNDLFQIDENPSGRDTITDFSSSDTLAVVHGAGQNKASFEVLQNGPNTVIRFFDADRAPAGQVTLENVAADGVDVKDNGDRWVFTL